MPTGTPEAPPRATRESIRQSIERTPVARRTAGYSDTMMKLLDARAHALGMHPDEYVGRRMAGVQNEPYKAKTPSLNEADHLDQGTDVPDFPGRAPDSHISKVQRAHISQFDPTEKVNEEHVQRLMKALRDNPEDVPAIVAEFGGENPDGSDRLDVVDGHHRLEAHRRLGNTDIPVRAHVSGDDWSDFKANGGSLKIRRPDATETLDQPAYHGTGNVEPYDRFDAGKVNGPGGEGAQAYGWGLYFAGRKEVAEYYRQGLSVRARGPGKVSVNGRNSKEVVKELLPDIGDSAEYRHAQTQEKDMAKVSAAFQERQERLAAAAHLELALMKAAEDGSGVNGAMAVLSKARSQASRVDARAIPQAEAVLRSLGDAKIERSKPELGRLYHVDIPEDHEYLQWERPLSDQPQAVRDLVGKHIDGLPKQSTGADIYRDFGDIAQGDAKYKGMKRDEAASRWLNERGVPGIKFLDGSSRANGEGTHNYVVFDDKRISITHLEQGAPLSDARTAGHSPAVVKRGAISFLHDGRAIIQALEHSDESTIPHELMHMFRRELTDEDRSIAERWAGVKDGKWTRPQEERFARAGERWMRNGTAPIPELKGVFQKLHDWLKAIYTTIRNSPLDVKLTPEMEALFGRLFKPGQKLPKGMGDEAMREREAAPGEQESASGERARPSMNQKDAFGRPDLAKSGATDAGRTVEDQVDEARKLKPKGPTPDEVKEKASHADANDTNKVILERAQAGESYRNDEERAAAKIAIRKAVDAAGTDPEKIKAAARLVNAHRDVMAQWSKIGRQSWDELESPEQRWSHAREDVFDPPRGLAERMKAARKQADELFQKEGQSAKVKKLNAKLDALENENAARIAKVKRRVKGYGFDLEDKNAAWVHDPDQLQEVKRAITAANGDGWDAAHEVYLNSRHWSANLINPLGGVKTSADAVSILTHFGIERPLEALANSIGKGSADSATFREFPEILKGFGHALTGSEDGQVPSVWRSFWRSLKGDTHAFDQDFAHATAGENELHAFGATTYGQVPGTVGKTLRFSIRMVKALDSAMKTLAAHMDVGAQAVRLARRDGIAPEDLADFIKRQMGDTESEAWHNAVATARGLTFTAKPGVIVRKINELKYMSPKNGGERALKELMRYQFLFPGIPTQIIKKGLAMLPGVGPLMMLAKTGKALYETRPAGNGWSYSRGEFNKDLATSAVAGGLATILGTMVAGAKTDDGKDKVTGFNDQSRPTTVNLFGKDWNYKKALGPLAHPIATAMDFFHAEHAPGKEVDAHGKTVGHWGARERHGDAASAPANLSDRWHALVASLGEQAINESMWRSTVDLAKAVGEPVGQAVKGEDMTGNKLAAFMGNFVTGFVPTVLKQAGGALNPAEEDRKLDGDFWHRLGQSALYNLDVPGLQAPPKVGYFGQPITKETLGGPATTFLWRLTGGEKLGDAPDASLGSRVVTRWNELHEDHPFPAIPSKIPGASEAQRNEILARAGKATETRISGIVGLNPNEPSFRSMRAILYLHQQEVQRATKQVLGR